MEVQGRLNAPLRGIRVLDLSQALAGPAATRMLADLGAEIIKIEPPGEGEPARRMGTSFEAGESYYYMLMNRNKRGLTLNLRHDQGRRIFYSLARISDAVLDNFRPGVTTRLGVDFDTVRKVNPSIVCCSISGFGQEGPYSQRPVFDSVIQALSGAMSVTGEPEGPPNVMGFAVTDIAGGYGATVGLLAALLERERTGVGRYVDLSLLDIQLTFQGHLSEAYLGGGRVPGPGGSVQSANLPNGAFRTLDGGYLQIHCATQKFYDILAESLAQHVEGLEGLAQDQRFLHIQGRRENWEELREVLEKAFSTKTSAQWMELLGDTVPIAPVNTIAQAFDDPQVRLRNMVVEADHPLVGKYSMPGNPIKMGYEAAHAPAPTLGQHNREVLASLLGYTEEEIEALGREQVI